MGDQKLNRADNDAFDSEKHTFLLFCNIIVFTYLFASNDLAITYNCFHV